MKSSICCKKNAICSIYRNEINAIPSGDVRYHRFDPIAELTTQLAKKVCD